MAEYKGFDASDKKKRKALQEGNVLRVPYFYQIVYFSLLILTSYISIAVNFENKAASLKQCVINPFNMLQSCVELYVESFIVFCFIPMIVSLILLVAIIGYINRKNFLIFSLAKFNLKKVNPASGFINFFSSFKDIWLMGVKLLFLVVFLVYFLRNKITFLMSQFLQDVNFIMYLGIFKNFLVGVILAFFAGAIIEYFVKKRRYNCELSMSIDELKREYKEDEGDPHIKSQRKSLHEAILMQKIEEKVKKAKVIIVD